MTVGLVVVSHAALIAQGVAELAGQMAAEVRIVAAGGTDDGGLGTSFDLVAASLERADDGDGVVVLCDLGSAVLTAETAAEFAEAPDRIRIADAPVVEGAVAAAVAAAAGEDLDGVLRAAESASGAPSGPSAGDAVPAEPEAGSASLEIELDNEHGLHARPAANLVKLASGYDAHITINGVNATSMLQVIGLGLERGATVTFVATGPDASAAIDAIGALVRDGFGEESQEAP